MQSWSGNPLTRSGDKKDTEFVQNAKKGAAYVAVTTGGALLTTKCSRLPEAIEVRRPLFGAPDGSFDYRLVWLPAAVIDKAADSHAERILLGTAGDSFGVCLGPALWAVSVSGTFLDTLQKQHPSSVQDWQWQKGRELLGHMRKAELAVAGQALALVSWHSKNRFSPVNGLPTEAIEAGAKRADQQGKTRVYPRVDPVAIFAIISPDNQHILLGRSARFKKQGRQGFFSCLAGFIEPCEGVEEAVRREAHEEASVEVGVVQLELTQPWPIGRAGSCELMIGCFAQAVGRPGELPRAAPNDGELAEAVWFSRAQATAMLKRSLEGVRDGGVDVDEAVVPGDYAIAHHLIHRWAVEGFSFKTVAAGTNVATGGWVAAGAGLGAAITCGLFMAYL